MEGKFTLTLAYIFYVVGTEKVYALNKFIEIRNEELVNIGRHTLNKVYRAGGLNITDYDEERTFFNDL